MPNTVDAVRMEYGRFSQALPDLLQRIPGRWIVFKDGAVVSHHATEEEAFAAGLDEFGEGGGQVIALVAEIISQPKTESVLFWQ